MMASTSTQEKTKWKTLCDFTGKKVGEWTVLGRAENKYGNVAYWFCKCSCGNLKVVCGRSLKSGVSTKCKTCHAKKIGERVTTHGFCKGKKIPEYNIWRSMISRCHNPKTLHFYNYGGRGIEVCKEWRESFPQFLKDIGFRPKENYSIDRIDNSKGYFKENVRWANGKTQAKNTRKQNLMVNEKIISITDLAEKYNICRSSFIDYVRDGFTIKDFKEFKKLKSCFEKSVFRKKTKKAPVMIGKFYNLTPE